MFMADRHNHLVVESELVPEPAGLLDRSGDFCVPDDSGDGRVWPTPLEAGRWMLCGNPARPTVDCSIQAAVVEADITDESVGVGRGRALPKLLRVRSRRWFDVR